MSGFLTWLERLFGKVKPPAFPKIKWTTLMREARATWKITSVFEQAGKIGWSVYDNVSRQHAELWLGGRRVQDVPGAETLSMDPKRDAKGNLHFAHEDTGIKSTWLDKDGKVNRGAVMPRNYGGAILIRNGRALHVRGDRDSDQHLHDAETGADKGNTRINCFITDAETDKSGHEWFAANDGAEPGFHRPDINLRKSGLAMAFCKYGADLHGGLGNTLYRINGTDIMPICTVSEMKEIHDLKAWRSFIFAVGVSEHGDYAVLIDPARKQRYSIIGYQRREQKITSLFDNCNCVTDDGQLLWGYAEDARAVILRGVA